MKYTIEGFSQEYACSLKKETEDGKILKLDCTDLVILRWFVDFYPKMKKTIVDNREYAFLNHRYLEEQLPLLDISKRAFGDRMKKMAELEVLAYTFLKGNKGTFSLYTFGEKYINLIAYQEGIRPNVDGVYVETCTGCTSERIRGTPSNADGVYVETCTKDSSIINSSIKDSSTTDTQEAGARKRYDYQAYLDRYHSICTNLPRVVALNDQRKKAVREFEKQFTFDQFDEICRKANVSAFLTGKTSTNGWRADFEFLLRPKQAVRILEGGYDDSQKPPIYDPDAEGLKY